MVTAKQFKKLFRNLLSFFEKNKKPIPHPYILTVNNNGKENAEVVLFGAKNVLAHNYGNIPQVNIKYDLSFFFDEDGYKALLFDTISQPFTCGRIRIESNNLKQLESLVLNIEQHNTKGERNNLKIECKSREERFHKNAIEILCDLDITGNTQIKYTHLASDNENPIYIRFFFYPKKKVIYGNLLSGKPFVVEYEISTTQWHNNS